MGKKNRQIYKRFSSKPLGWVTNGAMNDYIRRLNNKCLQFIKENETEEKKGKELELSI